MDEDVQRLSCAAESRVDARGVGVATRSASIDGTSDRRAFMLCFNCSCVRCCVRRAVVGEVDEEADHAIEWGTVKGEPLRPIVHYMQ